MKKIISVTLLSAIALTATTPVFANATGGTYSSNGVIGYVAGSGQTNPVDPLDPSTPVVPTVPTFPNGTPTNLPNGSTDGGSDGPLSIDFASSFNFGQQEITSVDKIYTATAQAYNNQISTANPTGVATKGPNYVQVTDNRGTLVGWNLSVTQADDFKTTDSDVLTGAVLTLGNPNHVTASQSNASAIASSNIVLIPKTSSGTILGSKAGEGAGTHLIDFGTQSTADSSVTLQVPGASTKLAKVYTAQLVWSLAATPAN